MEINANVVSLFVETVTTLSAVGIVVYKLGRSVEKFETVGKQQSHEISELKNEVKVVGDVITKIALQTQRQDTSENRINRLEQLIEDMRRGEGFILPINPRPSA